MVVSSNPAQVIFATLVFKLSSTITLPLSSTLTPALSSPKPSVCGFLPVEIKIWSAFKVILSPLLTDYTVI